MHQRYKTLDESQRTCFIGRRHLDTPSKSLHMILLARFLLPVLQVMMYRDTVRRCEVYFYTT